MSNQLKIESVTTLDLPGLQPYRTLRRPVEHMRSGIFIAEGEKVVRRLLASGLPIDSFLLTPEWLESLTTELDAYSTTMPTIFLAERSILEQIVGITLHQGIMAQARVPVEKPFDEVIGNLPSPHFIVALDGLANSENVGAVVRNCAAFGVDAIIVGETSSSPYLRRAVRNSMGTVFKMRVAHVQDLALTLQSLHSSHETRVIAAHAHEQVTIGESKLAGNICIVLGSEGDGISERVLDTSSDRVMIPMMNDTDSLNVASASAVFLYEAQKQRSLLK